MIDKGKRMEIQIIITPFTTLSPSSFRDQFSTYIWEQALVSQTH